MKAVRKMTFPLLLLHLIFLVAPTLFVMYRAIARINEQSPFLTSGNFWEAASFGIGLTVAYIMYVYRARFFITFGLLLFAEWSIYKTLPFLPGEFDVFFVSVRFWHFAILFTVAWLAGFGLARWRHFPLLFAAILFAGHIMMSVERISYIGYSEQITSYVDEIQRLTFDALLPIAVYALYMVFTAEALRDVLEVRFGGLMRFTGRLALFLLLLMGSVWGAVELTRPDISEKEAKDMLGLGQDSAGGQGGVDTTSMMRRNPSDGKHSMKDYAQMKNNLGSGGNKLLFCAYLPNFLGPDSIPNPLYFTSYYLTYYDTAHERFERDSLMPSNDLFYPEPVSIPLFKTKSDTSVIRKGMGDKKRRTVTCDVYYKELSPKDFVAPSTAFSCQPITVEEEFRKEFQFAMKTKSYISELNSAYFIYNTDQPAIKAFQEVRFQELRKVRNYDKMDRKVFDYYTKNPEGSLFDSIAVEAREAAKNATTPIDKVLAVRDYFLAKDEFGDPRFVYSLNVGKPDDPNIANARMLRTFMFKERRGYCTYYAGASLFMLRSLGIPTRFVVGFLTQDRADKNKGWYWFYSNQGHAWIQVYFPGYGWMDFDTTVGNTDQRESPQPDGTPPLQPPRAWLVVNGVLAADPDTVKKEVRLKFDQGIYYDKDFRMAEPAEMTFDAAQAKVLDLKGPRALKEAKAGDSVMIVAYDDASKIVPRPRRELRPEQQVLGANQPVIADELHLKPIPDKKQEQKKQAAKKEKEFSWWTLFWAGIGFTLFLVLLLFSFPTICYFWYKRKAAAKRDPKERAYWIYRHSMFTYNQLGVLRDETETPLEYAREKVDKQFGAGFEEFMRVYLKVKYANLPPDQYDIEVMNRYFPAFTKKVFPKFKGHQVFAKFLNVALTHRFLKRPKEEKKT